MALFPNVVSDYTFGGRTHTNLVVSDGIAPAEKWIVSKNNPATPFVYPFGPWGNQTVILAKGKIVEAGAPEYDPETGRMVSTIQQAAPNSIKAIGVLHHNVYEYQRDRFSSNQPVVITRQYIEVPLFEHDVLATASSFAQAMHFGAAYGDNGANKIQPGDFVKVGDNGNFVKADPNNDSPYRIVGQVLAVERELPPAGFLQYYTGMTINQITGLPFDELEQFLMAKSYAPSPGEDPGSAGAYPMGYPYDIKSWRANFERLLYNPQFVNKGIPLLTDGFFRAKQTVTNISIDDIYNAQTNNDGHIENVVYSGQITFLTFDNTKSTYQNSPNNAVTQDLKTAPNSRNNALFIKFRHKIDRTEPTPITVKYSQNTITGAAAPYTENVGPTQTFAAQDVHIDWFNNTVVVYLEPNKTYNDIVIDAKLIVDPIAGIPTEWDYSGSVGAVRILLQR